MNKCKETWKYLQLEACDIIGLTETWAEEETWKKVEQIIRQICMKLYTTKKREEERKGQRRDNNSDK